MLFVTTCTPAGRGEAPQSILTSAAGALSLVMVWSRLWLFRGGFVYPCRWVAFGFGRGFVLVFLSFAFGVRRVRWFRFSTFGDHSDGIGAV